MYRNGTASEFSSIRNYPHVEVKHCPGKRVGMIYIHYCGKEVAHKTIEYNRNKIVCESYVIDEEFLQKINPQLTS